ncbi:MAG: molybdopterin-guanine dinucleotide biosynthesis protein MobB [Bacteroidetes bacterium]|nr:molybdopterin-guanine dinucleotide biosynthesis protein MobB [Bacteroidota bacterium]
MYINITDSETADNKGSSSALVHYLDKEIRLDKEKAPELWFNHEQQNISSFDATQALDNNLAKLMKTDAKFFLINISPSQKEIAFLKEKYGEEGAKEQLKAYAAKIMDEYALNFKRPGIDNGKDLLWFGKLENYRYYGHKDPEVKQGLKKRGDRKPGEQLHIQVIVSRKDITNKIKLSPMNKSRGRNAEHSQKLGQFDRSAFKQSGENVFDKQFGFERGLSDTFRYANSQKKGTLEERMAIHAEKREQETKRQTQPIESQRSINKMQTQALSAAMVKISLPKAGFDVAPSITRKKKKRKTIEQQQDQGLGL